MGLGECFQSAFTPSLDRKFSIYTCIAKRLHEKYRTFLQNKKTVQARVNMMVGTPPTPPPRLRGELRYAPHHHRRGRRRNQAHRPQHRAQFLACGLLRGVLRGEHRREHGRRAADPRSDQRIAQQQPAVARAARGRSSAYRVCAGSTQRRRKRAFARSDGVLRVVRWMSVAH